MKRLVPISFALLVVTTTAQAQHTLSVKFDFELENLFLGSKRQLGELEAGVAGDLAQELDGHVGFLDFVPGEKDSQAYHLSVALVPTVQGVETGVGNSFIRFELSGGEGAIATADPIPFVPPEVLVDYQGREDLQKRIRTQFAARLPDNRRQIVEQLLSQIPIGKDASIGYWAQGNLAFVPIPYFYSDLDAQHDTEFRMTLGAAGPFDDAVDLSVKSLSYKKRIAEHRAMFEEAFADVLETGYPADYWAGKENRHPIICELSEPTSLPGVTADSLAAEGEAKGVLAVSEIYVTKYEHHQWPLDKKKPGGESKPE
jgi:hypothetical protein